MSKLHSHGYVQPVRVTMTLLLVLGVILVTPQSISAQTDDPSPPAETVKLIFIHHSCGENWLDDNHGGLGQALKKAPDNSANPCCQQHLQIEGGRLRFSPLSENQEQL